MKKFVYVSFNTERENIEQLNKQFVYFLFGRSSLTEEAIVATSLRLLEALTNRFHLPFQVSPKHRLTKYDKVHAVSIFTKS